MSCRADVAEGPGSEPPKPTFPDGAGEHTRFNWPSGFLSLHFVIEFQIRNVGQAFVAAGGFHAEYCQDLGELADSSLRSGIGSGKQGNWRPSGASPLGRIAEPIDVVRVMRFLLSEDAGYVTGTIIPVDGGTRAAFVPPR